MIEELKEMILQEARELAQEISENRRELHRYAEIGFDLPQTVKFVTEKLAEYGYEPQLCGKAGVIASVGKPGKTILLRADIDALPIPEQTGLDFAASNGNSHACGHDCHPAMLLGAAKLLKKHEVELNGTVKLMFQPAEEILQGAQDMINNGLMENPSVDAAFGMHVAVGNEYSHGGKLICRRGKLNRSGDAVRVTIHGKDAHGSRPNAGIDALSIASYINLALQTVIAREIASDANNVLLVGTTHGGTSANSVPGEAVMELTVRTSENDQRDFLIQRVSEVAEHIAAAFRATVTVEHLFGAPSMDNAEPMTEDMIGFAIELLGEEDVMLDAPKGSGGGEDFSFVAEKVPTVFFNLGVGSKEEGYEFGGHTPFVTFNEEALPVGAAVHTYLALRWLQEN